MGTGNKYPVNKNEGTVHNYSSFTYKIIRKNRKTIGIKVTEKGEIIVASPSYVSEKTIGSIVKQKEDWILKRISFAEKEQLLDKSRSFVTGEEILYLGKKVALQIVENSNGRHDIIIFNDKLIINKNKDEKEDVIKGAIIKFYKEEARKIFIDRTSFYSNIIAVHPHRITIKDQKTIWGSCSTNKNINYNYRLIMAPKDIIDYVVVHELCHLVHMNHSKEYWCTVESVLPDYKRRRQWLKYNGYILKI